MYISGFVLDDVNGLCYKIMADVSHFEASATSCESLDAELVQEPI
jgi:hypothetical protein